MITLQDIKNELGILLNDQKETNAAIENTPQNNQGSLIYLRNKARAQYNTFQNIWGKINASQNTDSILMQNILTQAYNYVLDCIAQEKQIVAQATFLIPTNVSPNGNGASKNLGALNTKAVPRTLGSLSSDIMSIFTGGSNTPTTYTAEPGDEAAGEAAMQAFFNEAQQYSGTGLPGDFPTFVSQITAVSPAFFSSIGYAIRVDGMSASDAASAMSSMADASQGMMPTNLTSFFSAISQEATNPSIWQALEFVAWSSAQEIVQGTASAGQSLLTGISSTLSLTQYLPWILGIGGVLALMFYSGTFTHLVEDTAKGKL